MGHSISCSRYDSSMSTESANGTGAAAGCGALLVALLLLYIGGWYVVWSDPAGFIQDAIWFANNGIAIRVNGSYYGIAFWARWFDAPAISWAFGAISFGCLFFRGK